jgi:TatD DNase family protein
MGQVFMRLYDAHNHLQDERLKSRREEVFAQAVRSGVVRMVVNGACEADWGEVLGLARAHPEVLPSFGYHPWYLRERTADWQQRLVEYLDRIPSAVGEIGLDRWILDRHQRAVKTGGLSPAASGPAPLEEQAEVFTWQLRLAAERNLPVSIHCLQAWGLLHDILRREPRPACGFLLHSYGGPVELVRPLADLGAYYSLPGFYAHERKQRQREAFKQVPFNRLLIETDAPDQSLPGDRNRFPLADGATGKPINHPANLAAVYAFGAELLGQSISELANQVEQNFLELFGGVCR